MKSGEFTLLVVDDDHEDLEIFCEAIRLIDASIRCLMAYDGKEALSVLRSLAVLPKVVFLDNNMPQMSGKRCLAYIKEDVSLRHVPVVMYSTFFSAEDTHDFTRAGANVLKKQVDFSDIVKHLSLILRQLYPDFFEKHLP